VIPLDTWFESPELPFFVRLQEYNFIVPGIAFLVDMDRASRNP